MSLSIASNDPHQATRRAEVRALESATIRFAGDSGDGMQLAGTQFTNASAILGNDISTLPDFPAEIRAPAGTLAGVSGFQVHFSSQDIHTPGDHLNALVAIMMMSKVAQPTVPRLPRTRPIMARMSLVTAP